MVNFVPQFFETLPKPSSVGVCMDINDALTVSLYSLIPGTGTQAFNHLRGPRPSCRHFVKKLSSLRAVADSTLPFATLSPSQKVSQSELFLFPVRARENPVYLQVTNRYAERRGVKPSYKAKCRQAPLAWRHGAVPWRPPARYLSYSQHLPTPALSLLSLSEPTFVVQRYLASLRQDLY